MESQKTQIDKRFESGSTKELDTASASSGKATALFAAAVYPAKKGGCKGLAPFVESLKKSGVRVGGIIQEKVPMGNGSMRRVDAVDIATGQRIPLNQPTTENWHNRECSLDHSALTETTAILRQATMDRVDLMVVEKFGDAERDGEGLSDEILQGIAAGIPLLIAVPETNCEAWTELTGGMGAVLSSEENALHEWWELIQSENAGLSLGTSA
ncbi:MAG: DUF2478 domain-containing protein [Rhodospirillales bacterium]|nr:DUF2478 domain-containing protein [Alphaproteobacteria bacterium]MBL6947394.1 DUF2478 domain-containing protein [Rhodospirillales bacterium]